MVGLTHEHKLPNQTAKPKLEIADQITDHSFLEKLTQLQTLDLRNNQIIDIQFLQKLPQLQSLDLSYNQINDYRSLEKLTQLRILDLRNNQIINIQFLEKLTQLRTLDLRNNQIIDIQFLKKLPQLQTLDLKNNQITDIQFLEKLTQLQTLDLKNNQITSFPEQFLYAWPFLHTLHLHDNPIENIPKELFDGEYNNALLDIRGYFASIAQESIQNDEVKLIVVGNTTAGKTSLMRFIQEGYYEKSQNSTHGIALTRWPIPDRRLQTNIWDFGGQEYYHATHRLFLDDHAVYVVVWEANTNTEQILPTNIHLSGKFYRLSLEHFPYSYWLDSIRYYAPNSPILLVQNKTLVQQRGQEENEQHEREAEPAPVDCFKPVYNVHSPDYHVSVYQANKFQNDANSPAWTAFQAFKTNLIHTLETNAAGYKLGKGWVAIRNKIRQLPENQRWMTRTQFEVFCQQTVTAATLSFDPAIEMSGLLTYLSGAASTILYYANDDQLRDTVFLNPQWVTDTIYDILSYDIREKDENKGEFSRSDVEQVLRKKGLAELTDRFLDLMKKDRFELIFEKPNCPDEYIAPQYLPDKYHDQKALAQLRPETSIRFTLHYPRFIPKSVFMRFMVAYGNLAENVYWKYGIVLGRKASERVIAECHFDKRQITVQIVDGPGAKARARAFFNTLWTLSGQKNDIELSVNEPDFVEIGELADWLNDNEDARIKSKQGNKVPVKGFAYLIGKEPIKEEIPIIDPVEPPAIIPTMSTIPDINTPEIFFSYAWGDEHETGESREKIVNDLYESLKKDGYRVVQDKKNLGYRKSISDFMKRIGKGNLLIVAISDKYLKSPYCMFEMYKAYRDCKFERDILIEKIFPIRVESLNLALTGPKRTEYRQHWREAKKAADEYMGEFLHETTAKEKVEHERLTSTYSKIGDLFEILHDLNADTKDLLSADNFAKIKEAIKERIDSLKS